jgi:hypothetical protein
LATTVCCAPAGSSGFSSLMQAARPDDFEPAIVAGLNCRSETAHVMAGGIPFLHRERGRYHCMAAID